jgi:hypothetical protein
MTIRRIPASDLVPLQTSHGYVDAVNGEVAC